MFGRRNAIGREILSKVGVRGESFYALAVIIVNLGIDLPKAKR